MYQRTSDYPRLVGTLGRTPFDQAGVAARAQEMGIGVHFAEEIASTMAIGSWLWAHAKPVDAWQVLVAGRQPAGVGHSGAWLSHELDLKCTILIPELSSATMAQHVRMAAGLSVVESLREVTQQPQLPLAVKWPNDVRVVLPAAYRKIAGTLCNTVYDPITYRMLSQRGLSAPVGFAALGVGIGLVPPESDPLVKHYDREVPLSQVACDLYSLTGTIYPREEVLLAFLRSFRRRFEQAVQVERELPEEFYRHLAQSRDGVVVAHFAPGRIPSQLQEAPREGEGICCRLRQIGSSTVLFSTLEGSLEFAVPYEDLVRTHPAGVIDV